MCRIKILTPPQTPPLQGRGAATAILRGRGSVGTPLSCRGTAANILSVGTPLPRRRAAANILSVGTPLPRRGGAGVGSVTSTTPNYCLILLALLTMALTAACSSDSTLEDTQVVERFEPVPLKFGFSSAAESSSETPQNVNARATRAASLESKYTDFKVGTWKAFGSEQQQTVMNGYKVEHNTPATSDAKYTYNWVYEGVLTGQSLRYWDLSAFPYEFRAVAPYMASTSITDAGLTVSGVNFRAQTLTNDAYNYTTAQSEPCVVAQVKREKDGTDYKDTDALSNNSDKEINKTAKADATRAVHVPFHHLMSQIGFRIYIDNPQPVNHEWDDGIGGDEYSVWIDNIVITVKNAETGFIYESIGYTATNAGGLKNGTFNGTTTTTDEYTLLSHNAYTLDSHNLHGHLNKESALDLVPNCLQQIPQTGMKVRVQLRLKTNHVEPSEQQFTYDTWLTLDKTSPTGDVFTWEPDKRYIYYLHIENLHGHEIVLHTVDILPWDEVQTTNINVGL